MESSNPSQNIQLLGEKGEEKNNISTLTESEKGLSYNVKIL